MLYNYAVCQVIFVSNLYFEDTVYFRKSLRVYYLAKASFVS